MKIVILIYLLLNPFAYVWGQDLRQTQEFFFQMSSLILILSSLAFQPVVKKISFNERWLNVAIVSMFIWFMCVFLKDKMGWSILLNVFLGVGVYLTVIRHIDYNDIKFIVKNSLWIAVYAIWHLAFQFLGFDLRGNITMNTQNIVPKCSIFGLEAFYGLYLAMIFPLFLGISSIVNMDLGQRGMRVLNIAGILAFIALLFLALVPSHSTGAYLGLLIAILIYLWHKARLVFWTALIPIFIGALLFFVKIDNPMGMQSSRLDMWGKVIQDSHQKPFGHGLDSFRADEREGAVRYFKYAFNDKTVRVKKIGNDWMTQEPPPKELLDNIEKTKNGQPTGTMNFWDNPHNDYIQLFYEGGFPAIIILGFILFFLYKVFEFSMRKPLTVACYASLVSIAVFNTMQFGFHVTRIGHMIPIVAGMFIVSARDEN